MKTTDEDIVLQDFLFSLNLLLELNNRPRYYMRSNIVANEVNEHDVSSGI